MRRALVWLLFVTAACGAAGPDAPPVGDTELACIDALCVTYPAGWDVETGDTFLGFSHPAEPATIVASASNVNMEGVVVAAGGTWPAPPDQVVRSFWELLDEGGDARLESLFVQSDGSIRSEGGFEGGVLWHRLVPSIGSAALGIEVRAPNRSWEAHADVFLAGLVEAAP